MDPSAAPRLAAQGVGGRSADPDRLGPYRIDGRLGEGGMGTVYRAQRDDGMWVALKVVRSCALDEPGFAERFEREASLAARIEHENVARLIDHGSADGRRYLAFELLAGGDLDGLIARRGCLTPAKALRVVRDAARGVQALHRAGLIHRDIKPANIFLDGRDRVRVGDLGLARHAEGDDRMTRSGTAVGTPAYMAPEMLTGIGSGDASVDVYALGASLYKMVTGRDPFVAETVYLLTSRIINEPAPDPRACDPSVTPEIAAIVKQAMRKDSSDRYRDCESFIQDVSAALEARPLIHAPVDHRPVTVSGEDVETSGSGAAARAIVSRQSAPPVGSGWSLPRIGSGTARMGALLALVLSMGWGLSRMAESVATAPISPERSWQQELGYDDRGPWVTAAVPGAGFRMRWAPEGAFSMGSPAVEDRHEPWERQREVAISAGFWIAEHEVTADQYQAVMGALPPGASAGGYPLSEVTHADARAFCDRLAEALGLPGERVRLPTEAEWEYACRAGTTGPYGAPDQDPDAVGIFAPEPLRREWYAAAEAGVPPQETEARIDSLVRRLRSLGDDRLRAQRPGRRHPNAWGLVDVHGNLAEWCLDAWDGESPYPEEPAVDPLGEGSELRVVRGGSWYDPPWHGRSAARMAIPPTVADPTIGFRFVVIGDSPRPGRGRLYGR